MDNIDYGLLRQVGLGLIGFGGIYFLVMMTQAIIALSTLFYNNALAKKVKPFAIWLIFFFSQVWVLIGLIITGVSLRSESTIISISYLVVVYIVAMLLIAMGYWQYVLLKDILKVSLFNRLIKQSENWFSFSLLAMALLTPIDLFLQFPLLSGLMGVLIVILAACVILLGIKFFRKLILKANAEDDVEGIE